MHSPKKVACFCLPYDELKQYISMQSVAGAKFEINKYEYRTI